MRPGTRTKNGRPSTATRKFWFVSPAAIGLTRISLPSHSRAATASISIEIETSG